MPRLPPQRGRVPSHTPARVAGQGPSPGPASPADFYTPCWAGQMGSDGRGLDVDEAPLLSGSATHGS